MSGISNLPEWNAAIAQWADDTSDRVIRAVVATAHEVRNDAILRTPVSTGLLRAGWRPPTVSRVGDVATVVVENRVPYAVAVEFGTKAHTVYPRTKKALHFTVNGQSVFAKKADIPARAPRPMLRPAVDRVVPVLRQKLGG